MNIQILKHMVAEYEVQELIKAENDLMIKFSGTDHDIFLYAGELSHILAAQIIRHDMDRGLNFAEASRNFFRRLREAVRS